MTVRILCLALLLGCRLCAAAAIEDPRRAAPFDAIRSDNAALIESARDGLVPIAKLLIATGAKVDQGDAHGDHALNWAACFGRTDFVALMIEMGADLHRTGQTDDQPIEIAIRERHPQVVQLLRAAGAVARVGKDQPAAAP